MGRSDNTGTRAEFKKRSHRPWKPTLLEKAIHGTQTPDVPGNNSAIPYSIHDAVVIENQNANDNIQNNLTIGGFFQAPALSTTLTAEYALPNEGEKSFIMDEHSHLAEQQVKEEAKARKITEYKIHYAIEQIAHVEAQREAAEQALQKAERELILTKQQLNEAEILKQNSIAEKNNADLKERKALEQFYTSEKTKKEAQEQEKIALKQIELHEAARILAENEVIELQNEMQILKKEYQAMHEQQTQAMQYQVQEHTTKLKTKFETELMDIQDTNQHKLEALKLHFENKYFAAQDAFDANHKELQDIIAKVLAAQETLVNEKQELEATLVNEKQELEATLKQHQQQLQDFENARKQEQVATEALKSSLQSNTQEIATLQALLLAETQLKNQAITKEQFAVEQLIKIQKVIKMERQLRKIAEEKTNFALQKAKEFDLDRQFEIKVRKMAEEKAEKAMSQTSKALVHLLSNTVD